MLDFLTAEVREGTGAIELSLTEDGDIGVFKSGLKGAQGVGDTVEEAVRDYIRREAPGYPDAWPRNDIKTNGESNQEASAVAQSYVDEDGPVAEALCELKAAADYIEEKTDSKLGAGRMHRLANEAADAVGLEIREIT